MYRYTTFEEEENRKKIRGRVLSVLEFDKIRTRLFEHAHTCYGRELVNDLVPTTDYDVVKETLNDTAEAYSYINKYGPLPLSGFFDVKAVLLFAKAGGVLSMRQLLDVASFLRAVDRLLNCFSGEHNDMKETNLYISVMALHPVKLLEKQISSCIASEDDMYDRASEDLYTIRREKKDLQQSIRVLLDRVIRNNEDALQESLITIREDRYCVPVKAECKSKIPGIIHDTSSTGQTVFIEPLSVVEANNRIRELLSLEREEIQRILEMLTSSALRESDKLLSDASIIGCVDFSCAKAELAIAMEAICPSVNTNGNVRLVKARHPLISSEKVVPVDISIGKDYKTLVITGPNTGGKTVSLKTLGLMTLMCMAGLMVPCAIGTEISVFDRVLADIGDEQSIEQSLSTFSAHMSNIVFIMKNIRGSSLVLLDELGSGTDPAEGAALAVAILEELKERGCVTMATTHYKELKAYAVECDGVMNAACEFDTETLSPTYRLTIGMPGVSNAFVISRKIGIPEKILEVAVSNLNNDELAFERLLETAETNNREAERLKKANEQLNIELTEKKKALVDEHAALKASKTRILNESRANEKEMLEEKLEEIDELLADLKTNRKKQSEEERSIELDRIRRRLRAGVKDISVADSDFEVIDKTSLPGEAPKVINKGQMYYVPYLDMMAVTLDTPNRSGKVQVESGSVKLTVDASNLRLPTKSQMDDIKKEKSSTAKQDRSKPYVRKNPSAVKITAERAQNISAELMLLGMTVDEAEQKLDRYLDDCSMTGIATVRIVHGKGTGALRNAVDVYLRSDPRVLSHRLGSQGEGDDGVTIAQLK